ncbi:hypothetical protein FRB96_007657 [Tulasnella sp. 330]|nr:hypothetical protein FRB96_007657 [Tulasnella sp. 330]
MVAVRIKLSRTVASADDVSSASLLPRQVGLDLLNAYDVLYMANISIGGVVAVAFQAHHLLYVLGPADHSLVENSLASTSPSQQSLTYNISYSIGYAAGNIVTAPVAFAGTSVASQALLDVTSSNNPIFQYGANGILGLGFSSLSNINKTVSASGGATNGNAYLANAFAQNTSEPNFIAFALGRTNDLSTDVTSSFSIGEVDPAYAGITQTQAISTYPVSQPTRWTMLVDGYEYADGVKRNMSTTVPGAPGPVLLADTGASYAYAPPDVVNGLYGGITGASFSSATNTWSVPCDQEVNFALWIGGRKFDWHPLDLVVPSVSSNTTCYGSIMPSTTLDGFDFHGGDVFLRSVYALLDFGDYNAGGSRGNPYIRFWSLIDQPTASAEFHKIRGGTTAPYQSSSSASPNAVSSQPNTPANADVSATSASSDQVLVQNVNTLVSYAPIALGVLGLNAMLLLVLCGFAVVFMCRRKKGKKGRAAGNFTPPALGRPHSYQQVKEDLEDAETPITPRFPNSADLRFSTAPSYREVLRPNEAGVMGVRESFRMKNLEKGGSLTTPTKSYHDRSPSTASAVTTPGTSTFRPSNLANMTVAASESSPTKSSSGAGQELLFATSSPSRSLAALPGLSSASDSHSPHSETQASAIPGPLLNTRELISTNVDVERETLQQSGGHRSADARDNTGDYCEDPEEPLPIPTRRFRGAALQDTGKRENSMHASEDGNERQTIYFDAADVADGAKSPNSARPGGSGSPVSPFNARPTVNTTALGEGHSRSGSNLSGPGRSPVPSPSPSRSAFPTQSRTLAPSTLGPSRLTTIGEGNAGQARPGSYAGHTSPTLASARTPSNLGPQGIRSLQGGQNLTQQGEEDLTDQMRRPSFEHNTDVDAFADTRSYPRPRAPFANPTHRHSAT